MCGIAGLFSARPNTNINSITLKNMLARIQHRGPDENGIYLGEKIGLGNVRLSIIDIFSGQQPMSDQSKRYWIVYNGEIFNYIELRKELEKKGLRFKTNSDTEVLVQLFSIYGKQAVEKLNGQFAFAIWDTAKKELFLARDRVGIRPLFYTYQNETFTFASEIKSIFENPEVEAKLSAESLNQVFTFWTTITPNTIFQQIYELPPGHFMTVSGKGVDIKKYWQLDFSERFSKQDLPLGKAVGELEEIFNNAVKIRLRADVPVAAYLSGGIDSSITTSFIKDIEPNVLKTFSIGFKDHEFDETKYQKNAADYFNTEHYSIKISNTDIASNFYDVIWHTEIPVVRTAPTPMYCLSRLVKENNIKVVITGEGADEMLGGYNIFKEAMIREFWAKQPDSKIRPILLRKLYPYLPQMQASNPQMLKFFFGYKLRDTNNPFYSHLLRWNNTQHISNLLNKDIIHSLNGYDKYSNIYDMLPSNFEKWDVITRAQWLESNIFMSGYLLSSQGDRMAMANSVEGRYPFLDHRVIEYASKLPTDYKLNGLNEKYILKKLAKGRIPDTVLNRPKQAYRAPIIKSFLSKNAPHYLNELLSETNISKMGIFNSKQVSKLVANIKKKDVPTEIDNMSIAAILSTSILHHLFVDKGKGQLKNHDHIKLTTLIEN